MFGIISLSSCRNNEVKKSVKISKEIITPIAKPKFIDSMVINFNPQFIDLSKDEFINHYDFDSFFSNANIAETRKDYVAHMILLKLYLFHLRRAQQGYNLLDMREGNAKIMIDYFLEKNGFSIDSEFINSFVAYKVLKQKKNDKAINTLLLEIDEEINNNLKTASKEITKKAVDSASSNMTDISRIENESILDVWTDNGSFYLLSFKPNKVIYDFNPSCGYWFPSEVINNEIVFYWQINENCTFERGLRTKFKDIENPLEGNPFGKIKMINDSTLMINYYYKDWINKINYQEQETIDTLFPRFFKRIHL